MKWIKASERLPKNPGRYFVKAGRQSIPDNGDKNQVATFTSHKEWYLENHHHSRDFYYICPDEWLDEQGDAIPADLEQRAKEYANLFYPIKDYEMYESDYDYRTQCAKNEQVKEHYLAGAANHPQPEIVDQLRKANPYDNSALTPHVAWQIVWKQCCDTLQSLLSPSQPGSMEGEDLWQLFEHDLRQSQDINSLKSRYHITRK